MKKIIAGFWDRLGIGFSGLCAIHCLTAPFLISLVPVWPSLLIVNEYTHLVFILLIMPVAYFSLKRKNEVFSIALLMISGIILITTAWFFKESLGELGETLVTLAGSALLISGHWYNYKLKREIRYETAKLHT